MGVVYIVVLHKIYETFRRASITGRMLQVMNDFQRENSVTHIIAHDVEDLSHLLDELAKEA